jgi:hypothetical protein
MSNAVEIDVGKQFSRYPAGRTPSDGKYCGETFRERFIKDNLAKGVKVKVFLDNAVSYGSSFLEEAFGGLIRVYKYSYETVKDRLELNTTDPFLMDEIWTYIENASKAEIPQQ